MSIDNQIGLMRITNDYFKIWNQKENQTLYLEYDQMLDLSIQIEAMKNIVETSIEKKENDKNAMLVKTFHEGESVEA